jgi:hypothetical protein
MKSLLVLLISLSSVYSLCFAEVPSRDVAAVTTIALDPRQFNLRGIARDIDTNRSVFKDLCRITITQWTDGAISFRGSQSVEARNDGGSLSLVASASGPSSVDQMVFLGSQSEARSGGNVQTFPSFKLPRNVLNGMALRCYGNLVSADLICATTLTDGHYVQATASLSLGLIKPDGGFSQLQSPQLEGSNIIADLEKTPLETKVDSRRAPVVVNPLVPRMGRGFLSPAGSEMKVWVLTGYSLFVGKRDGKVVRVEVEPIYELQTAKAWINPASVEHCWLQR